MIHYYKKDASCRFLPEKRRCRYVIAAVVSVMLFLLQAQQVGAVPVSDVSRTEQAGKITGTVTDANGEGLIGATVQIKDSPNTGTVTDMDGNFILEAGPDAILLISYVGFRTREVAVNNRTSIHITLKENLELLDEVVVVGYGVQKKASVTGSVAAIQSDKLVKVKTPSVSNMLAGRLPGLRAVQRSGSPGDDAASVDIRGYGNMLVIVDGIERDYTQLNPNDIESISILKDASAAVYGFKGSNGVLLVTTKKGMLSKPKITYDGFYGIQQVTRYPELMNAYEYASLYNEGVLNLDPAKSVPYNADQLAAFREGAGTDWWEATIRKAAPQTSHNLSVSGGTEKVKYFMSVGYYDQSGLLKSNDWGYNRFTVRSNISLEVVKGFTVDLQLAGKYDKREMPDNGNHIFQDIQMALPVFSIYANDNPQYWQGPENPVQMSRSDQAGFDHRTRREFNGSLGFTWQVPWVKGLTAKALVAYDYRNTHNKQWAKNIDRYSYDASTGEYSKSVRRSLTTLQQKEENYYKPTQQYSLNYSNVFGGKHDVGVMVLWEMYHDNLAWLQGNKDYVIGIIPDLNFGDSKNQKTSGLTTETAHEGLVGRFNYAFDGKYLLEFNFRYDGSYKFESANRWGFFPGVSAGWRISEESFFKQLVPDIDNFKIRGSYALVGDEGDFDAYQYLDGYKLQSKYVMGKDKLTESYRIRGMANPWLTWYESKIMNIGFDASFKRGLVTLEFDYFQRHRSGLPSTRTGSLPTTFGQSMPQENLNSDENKGFEISLGHTYRIGDFRYNVNANFSATRILMNHVEREASANKYENWRKNTNERYQDIRWGKRVIGQFTSYEEILNSPVQDKNGNKSLMPGDLKFQDFNNDGIIDDNDMQPIGRGSTPRMYYGLNLSGEYKGFDLSAFFQGAAGHDIYIDNDLLDPFIQQGIGNGLSVMNNRWHREDPADPYSRWIPGYMPAIRTAGYADNRSENTWSLHKANYLRLKTLEAGYSLPSKLLGAYGIDRIRVYVNCNNLLTFTGNDELMKTIDPENDNNFLRYYPQTKSYNFGISVTF